MAIDGGGRLLPSGGSAPRMVGYCAATAGEGQRVEAGSRHRRVCRSRRGRRRTSIPSTEHAGRPARADRSRRVKSRRDDGRKILGLVVSDLVSGARVGIKSSRKLTRAVPVLDTKPSAPFFPRR